MNSLSPKSYEVALEKARNRPRKPQRAAVAPRAALPRLGKKGKEWLAARNWLKKHFRFRGIETCEARLPGCYYDNFLSFAHCRKRRKLLDGEIYHVALLCTPCHSVYEAMSHDDMHTRVHELIDKRGLIAP